MEVAFDDYQIEEIKHKIENHFLKKDPKNLIQNIKNLKKPEFLEIVRYIFILVKKRLF